MSIQSIYDVTIITEYYNLIRNVSKLLLFEQNRGKTI